MIADELRALAENWSGVDADRSALLALADRVAEVERDAERYQFVLHNAGLINAWAREWEPGKMTLIAYFELQIDAAMQEKSDAT